jgi:hypothetical protein
MKMPEDRCLFARVWREESQLQMVPVPNEPLGLKDLPPLLEQDAEKINGVILRPMRTTWVCAA